MNIVVTGATGRMGRAVIDGVRDRDWSVAAAVARTDAQVSGLRTRTDEEFLGVLETAEPDAVVDFSVPEATVRYAEACTTVGVPLVTGTTGLSQTELSRLEAATESIAVLKAANFAKGVQVLRQVVVSAIAALPTYDVELTETHHAGKRDAPSGTARAILEDVVAARSRETDDRSGTTEHMDDDRQTNGESGPRFVHGRDGDQPRQAGEIGVHARRAGNVRGEHEVLLAGDDELVRVSHRAESRAVFAAGALDAADWLVGRDPGWYEFAEVLGQ